jgi:hypothetical protein
MFAGRNLSATHIAFASTRVMATCAAVGQGVGTAAAFAVKHNLDPTKLPADLLMMKAIQQRLLRDDAFLLGCRIEVPEDMARQATITATSEVPGGEARQVVSGQTRSVHGQRGVPPNRSMPGTHRWMSDPADGFPVAIRLDWTRPITPREIHLIFDTGLHRHLTLSHHDGYTAKMHWGCPQPETIRDFSLQGKQGENWISLGEVRGNYQRRFVWHAESPREIMSLRIIVKATIGLDHARLCEVRVYGQ